MHVVLHLASICTLAIYLTPSCALVVHKAKRKGPWPKGVSWPRDLFKPDHSLPASAVATHSDKLSQFKVRTPIHPMHTHACSTSLDMRGVGGAHTHARHWTCAAWGGVRGVCFRANHMGEGGGKGGDEGLTPCL